MPPGRTQTGPMKITVTGAWGKAGRAVVTDLLEHGHEVRATDVVGPPDGGDLGAPLLRADLVDYGQALEALAGTDAVVHLGNIPAPGHATAPQTLSRNTAANGNVFLAAARLGLTKVVWASSETTLGLPFDTPPRYAPVDEAHFPVPTTGSRNVIIAAADTVMDRPSAELMAEVFPDVPLTRPLIGYETLLAIGGARELLGYDPQHSWRDHV